MGPIFNEKFDKKLNLWVHKQYTYALFTEDRSKVTATYHIPYINSTACWGKGVKKKKKKKKENAGNLKRSKRKVDPNSAYIIVKFYCCRVVRLSVVISTVVVRPYNCEVLLL